MSPPPRRRRPHLSPTRHLAGHRDHPGLVAASARHRRPFGLAPLRLHLGFPEFQLLMGSPLPLGVGISTLPRLDLGVRPTASVLGGPSSGGTHGVSLSSPASANPPWRLDWQTDLGVSGSLNRPGPAAFSADVAVSLVYEFDAVSFGQCQSDESGHEFCFADFLHEPTGTVTIGLAGSDGSVSAWAASATIEIFNLHVLRDQRNLDRLEIGLPVGVALQVDPTTGRSVVPQAGVSAEWHFNESVSVVVSGNVTFTPDSLGINIGASGTATLLIHGT